jgi:anti-sigma factor RsiW
VMVMRCRGARRKILAALDGELSTAEGEALNAHLSGCEPCRTAADEIARLHRALTAMPQATDLPAGLEAATLRRVRGVLATEGPARARFEAGRWWWVAAPLAATLAGVLVWRSVPGGPPTESHLGAAKPSPAPISPPAGEQIASRPATAAGRDSSPDAAAPPPQVAETLDLFLEMPILENMEKLQNFDAIRTVDLGEDGSEGRRG